MIQTLNCVPHYTLVDIITEIKNNPQTPVVLCLMFLILIYLLCLDILCMLSNHIILSCLLLILKFPCLFLPIKTKNHGIDQNLILKQAYWVTNFTFPGHEFRIEILSINQRVNFPLLQMSNFIASL